MKTIKNTIQKAFFALTFVFALNSNAQSVAINTDGSTADASAILDLKSTNQGVLVPRLTQSQRTMISAPATGLMVYQTDATAGFYFYNGTAWTSLSAAGATGATGAQGIQGLTGTTGATGNAGTNGATGLTGTAGTNGTIGATGLTGLTGTAGTNGAIGATGLTGTAGTNGTTGATGLTGTAGTNGTIGATGLTGTAGTNGTIGATGLTGLTGNAGTNGAIGAAGANGLSGTNGTNGATGLTGLTGTAGTNGSIGATGLTGTAGTNGTIGATGTAGTNGTNGQGLKTGGTANQVLAKVDGTDYNTQWITPTSGASTYPNVELHVENTTSQTVTSKANGASSTQLNFTGGNSSNALLTGGNTWTGNNTYTVGATGAGWYQISLQVHGTAIGGSTASSIGVLTYIDKNNAIGTAKTGALYRSGFAIYTGDNEFRGGSSINVYMYLAAGDNLKFYGVSASTTVDANTSSNGSTFLSIVRVK